MTMNSTTDTLPTTIQNRLELNANYDVALISLVILYYDYSLTLAAEVERFWNPPLTWASFFFFLNRYLGLIGHIPIIVTILFTESDLAKKNQVCQSLQSYHQYLAIFIQTVVGVLLIMRTYAFYHRSRRILVFLIGIAFAVVVSGCWSVITQSHKPGSEPDMWSTGCSPSVSDEDGIRFAVVWSGVLLFDIVIFALTVFRTVSISGGKPVFGRERGLGWGLGTGLIGILLRDGAIYFVVMGMVNMSNILTFLFGDAQIHGMASILTNVTSTTAISRLMLNLRDPQQIFPPDSTIDSSHPVVSTFMTVGSQTAMEISNDEGENTMTYVIGGGYRHVGYAKGAVVPRSNDIELVPIRPV